MAYAPHSPVDRTRTDGEERDGHPAPAARPRKRRLKQRIALGTLAALVVVFLGLSIPRYLTFDPTKGRLPPTDYPYYFPVLVVHVFGASVAMITCVLQIWPWLRNTHPRVHRYVGRAYVVAGVWPASVGAVVVSVLWAFGPVSGLSDIVLASLWATTTTYGFLLARRGRYVDHRRWMLRSFALTVSIIFNRILGLPITLILTPKLDTMFEGSERALVQAVSGCTTWVSWTLAFIIIEFVLDREQRRRKEPRLPPSIEQRESAAVVR